jgi:hypothetical protein
LPPPAHLGTKDQLAFGARVRNQHSSLVPAFDRWHRLHSRRDLLIVARARCVAIRGSGIASALVRRPPAWSC